MKYTFKHQEKSQKPAFNREKLVLSAILKPEQLYYMMDSQCDGLYEVEANDRRKVNGLNNLHELIHKSKFKLIVDKKIAIINAIHLLYTQNVAVLRKGHYFFIEVSCEDLVPGDMIFLSKGDVVPADIRIISTQNLQIDQSLYGKPNDTRDKGTEFNNDSNGIHFITDIPNICLTGSMVLDGTAQGMVITTGRATYLGHLLLL